MTTSGAGGPTMPPKIKRVQCIKCALEAPESLMRKIGGALTGGGRFQCRNAVACRKRESRVKGQFRATLSARS